MRSFRIIDVSPFVEVVLIAGQVISLEIAQHFRLQRAMKSLILALSLGMTGPGMRNSNAELHQPDRELGVFTIAGAPRWSVITSNAPWQTITTKDSGQQRARNFRSHLWTSLHG